MRIAQLKILNAVSMANGPVSSAVSIRQSFPFAAQANITGSGTIGGNLTLEGSLDYNQDLLGNIITAGNWNTVLNSSQAVSATGIFTWDTTQTGVPWIRVRYTPTTTGVQTITTVADTAKSLASTYFLFQTEAGAHKYALWFKVSGTGSAPSVSGFTNQEVDISTGDTAAAVATALATAMNGLTGVTSAIAASNVVTVTNSVAGPFVPIVDGTTATHFTFAVTTGGGTISAFLSVKGFT